MKKLGKIILSTLFVATMTTVVACGGKDDTAKMSFLTDGGSTVSDIEVKVGEEVTLPVPTREGYEFAGWYDNENFQGTPIKTVSANKGTTVYYAKWTQLCALTLDLDGGTLEQTTYYLKNGEKVADFLATVIPTKTGYRFTEWLDGTTKLSQNKTITQDGLTLKANYDVSYSVEVYVEKLDGDGYEKVTTLKKYGKVGEKTETAVVGYTDNTGYEEITSGDSVKEVTLSAKYTENVTKRYFNRKEFTLNFYSSFPTEKIAESKAVTIKYGQEMTVPTDTFTCNGYALIGWTTEQDGQTAEFKTNIKDVLLYNETTTATPDKLDYTQKSSFYAVWEKGYVNVFGGEDYIFLSDKSNKVAYLYRGGKFFKGEYSSTRKEVEFFDKNDNSMLVGKLNEDGTYSYNNLHRSEVTYSYYDVEEGVNDKISIYFDAYDGIEYKNNKEVSTGTYRVDADGNYVATFTTGELTGKTLHILVSSITLETTSTNVFRVRNEEEYGVTYYMGAINPSNNSLTYYPEVYALQLNGFGVATYQTPTGKTNYYYSFNETDHTLLLKNSENVVVGTAKTYEFSSATGKVQCYMFYKATFNQTFELANGEKLSLDGVNKAVYYGKDGTKKAEGYYTSSNSVFGGTVINLAGQYKFIITATVKEDPEIVEGEETEAEVIYTVEAKPAGYTEYYFRKDDKTYYAPLLVENDGEDGVSTLYGYTKDKTFVKVSVGTVTYDADTGTKTYTANEWFTGDILTDPMDAREISSMVFASGSTSSYNVIFLYSAKDKTNTETTYGETYQTTFDEKTLVLNSGFAVYNENLNIWKGTYTKEDNLVTANLSNGATSVVKYFEVNGTAFIELQFLPHTKAVLGADNKVTENTMVLDGKGNGVYTENGVTTNGTFYATEKQTAFGNTIYAFTAVGKTVNFVEVTVNKVTYLVKSDLTYAGDYYTDNTREELSLDAYGYAKYIDVNGVAHTGRYTVEKTDFVSMVVDGKKEYFDLDVDEFTTVGNEYGQYIIVDNQSIQDFYFEFDGYSTVTVFTLSETNDKQTVATGEYTVNGNQVTLQYTVASETTTMEVVIGTEVIMHKDEVFNVSFVSHKEVMRTYVNEKDWSMLVLDDAGGATKYDEAGVKQDGNYFLITDTLLYFVNKNGDDACIYVYNTDKGTATPVKFTARGYYTKDLDSLLFSQYGFAIFNNGERLYYNIDKGNVVIYRQDPQNPLASKYGFVEENFGTFESIKEYDGKTYYANNGYAIKFNRDETDNGAYPVTLTTGSTMRYAVGALSFAPNGAQEFKVTGNVKFDGYNANTDKTNMTVYRESDGHGGTVIYMTYGYYRFDLEIDYKGEDENGNSLSTYKIIGMRRVINAPSYAYLDNYYKYYVTMGAQYAMNYENNIGTLSVNYEYDEAGDEVESYVKAEFGEESHIYDSKGNILTFDKASFEFDTTTNIYTVSVTGEDGYLYRIYFGHIIHKAYSNNTFGYYVFYATREETLTTADGYTLKTERIVATDNPNTALGLFYKVSLKKGEEEYAYSGAIKRGNDIYYISRTIEEGKLIASTYFKLTFTENSDIQVEENPYLVPTYASVTIEKQEMVIVYSDDETYFMEMNADGEVSYIGVGNTLYLVRDYEYDETTKTYTLTTTNKTYTVKMNESGKIETVSEKAN